ncbi:Protocadherin-7 isoform X7 [Aix galericulata]|nr:Protocadherin-7 isoform X7 [Aix galericulata]
MFTEAPFRRVTFSVVSQPQDPHQGSLQSCYDSGLEESETPSSKSSSGPRLGALPLPEDNYERTTPDGSVALGMGVHYVTSAFVEIKTSV